MSIDYSATTFCAIFIDKEAIESMTTKIHEKTKKVKSYHPRTGKFLGMVDEVIHAAFDALVVDGVNYGNNHNCEKSLEDGLNDIAQGVCNEFSSCPNLGQDGENYGHFIGICLDTCAPDEAIRRIKLVNKHSTALCKAFNKYLGKGTAILSGTNGGCPNVYSVLCVD